MYVTRFFWALSKSKSNEPEILREGLSDTDIQCSSFVPNSPISVKRAFHSPIGGRFLLLHQLIKDPNALGLSNADKITIILQGRPVDRISNDSLEWWLFCATMYPHVARISQKFLSLQSSSVAFEPCFSVFGNISSTFRATLIDESFCSSLPSWSLRRYLRNWLKIEHWKFSNRFDLFSGRQCYWTNVSSVHLQIGWRVWTTRLGGVHVWWSPLKNDLKHVILIGFNLCPPYKGCLRY